jgi:N utilization substance protein B
MISRRNIRVKVMQVLYTLQTSEGTLTNQDPVKILKKELDTSRALFVYLIYFLTEVARYAETASRLRSSKNLPNYADLNVNTKLAGNLLLWKILESPSFPRVVDFDKPNLVENTGDMVKKLYNQLAETQEYKLYISQDGRDKKAEKEMLDFIFGTIMLPNEDFVSHVEEHFNNWDDDAEMMEQLVNNYLQKPGSYNLEEMVTREKWDFARNLLTTVREKKEYAGELIKPKLKNWDSERIAQIDMILMQMGICEFLYFETIPAKVTINEYIDLAKDYSTPQSGQFVNGILDSIHKELLTEGKLNKIDFKNKKA